MSRALESARVYSAMILEAARRGASQEGIVELVTDDVNRRFGQRPARADLEILVGGYLIYFQSKGQLTQLPRNSHSSAA